MFYLLPLIFFISCAEPTKPELPLCDKALLHITSCYYKNSYNNQLLYLVDWDNTCTLEKATNILALECTDPYFDRFHY